MTGVDQHRVGDTVVNGPSRPAGKTSMDARIGHHHTREWLALTTLCVSLLVVSLDTTVLNVALPTLVRDLHMSSSGLEWVVDAYMVVFAGLLLTAGDLGDRLGRKRVLFAGMAVFGGGSALSAFSGNTGELIAARSLMGIGGALIMPATLSILTNVFVEPRERAKAIGIWSGTSGLGVALGPIVGGWLLERFWWGSVFLVNVPIVVLGILAGIWLLPESRDPGAKRVDVLGSILSIAGLGTLVYSIIEAPNHGWLSMESIATFALGTVLTVAFVIWELHSDHPMLNVHFFRRARFSSASVAVALAIFALSGALFVLTQYLQFVRGYTALQTGLEIAPIALVLAAASAVSTFIERRTGTKAIVAVGLAIVAGGLFELSQVTTSSSYTSVLAAMLVMGLGLGIAMAPATESIMGSLPRERAGVGSATNSTVMQVGGALGVAILGSALSTKYTAHIGALLASYGRHVPAQVVHAIRSSLGGALAVAHKVGGAGGAALAHAARGGFVSGMDLALALGAAVTLAGVVVALVFLPSRPPDETDVQDASPPGVASRIYRQEPDGVVPARSSTPGSTTKLEATELEAQGSAPVLEAPGPVGTVASNRR